MIDKLKAELPQAMKSHDKVKVTVVRRLIADLQTVEGTNSVPLTEQNFLTSVKKAIKQNEEEIKARGDLDKYAEVVDTLKKEIAVLEGYLPTFLSKEKIVEILTQNLAQVKQAKNAGAAIGIAKKLVESFGAVEGLTLKQAAEEVYNSN